MLQICSGGTFVQCAVKALYDEVLFTTEEFTDKVMNVAADLCVHTNKKLYNGRD